ncbi:MAG: hypothetical protein N3E40_02015, partial [Dehalococcoidia bacterium]|nr:hypothetical protein [Dehalococcoidia bacterium]
MTDRSELLGELSRQFGLALDVLSAKSLSYDADGDCLANVRAAARLTGLTPVEVALYWLAKHIAT